MTNDTGRGATGDSQAKVAGALTRAHNKGVELGVSCSRLHLHSFVVLPHQAKTMTDVSSQRSKVFFDGTINLSQEEKSSHGTEDGSSL